MKIKMKINKFTLVLTLCMMAMNQLFAQNRFEKETLVYSTKDGNELLMDKYIDTSVPATGKRPVLMYIHGGGFATGSCINALQIKYCKHFASKGFVAIAINYRLGLKDVKTPTQELVMNAVNVACEDLFDATAFILKNAGKWNVDTARVLTSGGSAGAITALTAEYMLCNGNKLAERLPKDFNYGGIISHAGAVMTMEKSVVWNKKPYPMMLMHGDHDTAVAFDYADMLGIGVYGSHYLSEQFREMNTPYWLYNEVGADHIIAIKPLQYNFAEIDSFVDNFVMGGKQGHVYTEWQNEEPDNMSSVENMIKVVPLYILGFDKTDDELEVEMLKQQ